LNPLMAILVEIERRLSLAPIPIILHLSKEDLSHELGDHNPWASMAKGMNSGRAGSCSAARATSTGLYAIS